VSQLSRKLRQAEDGVVVFLCPGCKRGHALPIKGKSSTAKDKWEWNGDIERPVFHPSVHCYIAEHTIDGVKYPRETLCHSWVGKNGAAPGQIVFLGDSKGHQLRGVHELADWPNWEARMAEKDT
jgi:hypothetical protein